MKKYQFKSKASLENFIEGIDPSKYKVLEDDVVEILSYDDGDEKDYRIEDLQYSVKYLWSELEYVHRALAQHEEGHLPPIKGAGAMNEALTALGLDKDYEVKKPTLYANRRGEIEVDLSLLKKNEE